MPIACWPREERPREKLAARGSDALSDAELLAVLLRSGRRGQTAVDLARDLLVRFDGLAGLLALELDVLARPAGMGTAKATQLKAAFALGERCARAVLTRGATLSDPEACGSFLSLRLKGLVREVFAVVFVDSQHRVLAYEELFAGTLDGASVHPREVVRAALRHNAAAVVFAHNHPSGVAEPSDADVRITERLRAALALVDVRVLDHLIVGSGIVTSLARRGLI
jgi:DNA repair protein RadC